MSDGDVKWKELIDSRVRRGASPGAGGGRAPPAGDEQAHKASVNRLVSSSSAPLPGSALRRMLVRAPESLTAPAVRDVIVKRRAKPSRSVAALLGVSSGAARVRSFFAAIFSAKDSLNEMAQTPRAASSSRRAPRRRTTAG